MYNIGIFIYSCLMYLASIFHPKARKMIKGHKETFPILEKGIDKDASYIWFHAASLGEFEQGRPLIEKIKAERPEYKILLSFFSPSGYEVRKDYPQADIVCYLPFDTPANARKFIELARPEIAIFIKYEFWANYLNELHGKKIPVYLISGIFRKTQLFFRPYGKSYAKVLNNFTRFFVQNKQSQELLATKGLHNVTVCGDTRFDRVYQIARKKKEIPLIEKFHEKSKSANKPILVAGSTWEKDEEIIIPFFNEHPEMNLIIVPHEFNDSRLSELQGKLSRPSVLYSRANQENIEKADCVIIDCFGLLSSLYRYGNFAYVGGGFGTGIHNIIEAAVFGIPVLFGPNYRKFREAFDMIENKAGISIADKQELFDNLNHLIAYSSLREEMGKNAGTYVKANLGATNTIYQLIMNN